MKQGFSPVGLLISKTINTFSCIRRGLRLNWPSSSHLPRTTQALKKLQSDKDAILLHTPDTSPYHKDVLKYINDPLFNIPTNPMSITDTLAQIDIAIPKLRRNLHGSIRRSLRLSASQKMKEITEAAIIGKTKKKQYDIPWGPKSRFSTSQHYETPTTKSS
jgi:hypothetical protein